MLTGSVLLFAVGGSPNADEQGHSLAHGFATMFAAIVCLATGAAITLSSDCPFLHARSVDWGVITPVLLLAFRCWTGAVGTTGVADIKILRQAATVMRQPGPARRPSFA